ncbi:MAG TPA: multicopper oxidase domain-containing protein [Lachnospiraceae bacterium]|nr:multicopper oxidase domain-containing protein [Lachnospiraceae bacterium]
MDCFKKTDHSNSTYSISNIWENRIVAPDMQIAAYTRTPYIRHFHLTAEPIEHSILSNLKIKALGYNKTTPGPLIIMRQGEWIYLTVENRLDEPTALHVHGLSKPNSQDGAPEIEPSTPKIYPGESFTYKFLCWQSGTFFYHSSDVFQISRGLIGAFVVLPNDDCINYDMLPDRDFILLVQQWSIPQPTIGKVYPGTYEPDQFDQNPNFFTINGKSFPDTSPIFFDNGERIRIRFITKASTSHSMHLHGHDFQIVEEDGFPRDGIWDDTLNLPSGKRFSVELLANNPGVWPLNGTKTFHQSNNGEAPGGMITRVIYK